MTRDPKQPGYKAIQVLDYDPAWPKEFDEAAAKLDRLLDGLVADIEHIGSTSIPGMCAKPKIDVDIVLKSEELIPQGIERLKQVGYTYHGNKYDDGMWAFTTGRGSFGERVYLCAPGTPTHQKRLFFRNHLRAHPEDATSYALLKQQLASETDNDWDYYTGRKGPFIASIVKKAAKDQIRAVTKHKGQIVQEILSDLPEWFGIPAAIAAYMRRAEALPMFACLAPDGTAVGFLSLNVTSEFAVEVHVMGVKGGWHRMGLGRALIKAAKDHAVSKNARFLTTKTIAATKSDKNYAATRAFYETVGFLPVEVFPTHWGDGNPCLFMIHPLGRRAQGVISPSTGTDPMKAAIVISIRLPTRSLLARCLLRAIGIVAFVEPNTPVASLRSKPIIDSFFLNMNGSTNRNFMRRSRAYFALRLRRREYQPYFQGCLLVNLDR